MSPADRVGPVDPMDVSQSEDGEWLWGQDDDLLMVGALAPEDDEDDGWQVTLSCLEFVRAEPLESRLRDAVEAALAAVDGVEEVHEEDREVFLVIGSPDGRALVAAVATVMVQLGPEIVAHVDALG